MSFKKNKNLTPTELIFKWRQYADDQREVATQYDQFARDQMFKRGIAFGIDYCCDELTRWEDSRDSGKE